MLNWLGTLLLPHLCRARSQCLGRPVQSASPPPHRLLLQPGANKTKTRQTATDHKPQTTDGTPQNTTPDYQGSVFPHEACLLSCPSSFGGACARASICLVCLPAVFSILCHLPSAPALPLAGCATSTAT